MPGAPHRERQDAPRGARSGAVRRGSGGKRKQRGMELAGRGACRTDARSPGSGSGRECLTLNMPPGAVGQGGPWAVGERVLTFRVFRDRLRARQQEQQHRPSGPDARALAPAPSGVRGEVPPLFR